MNTFQITLNLTNEEVQAFLFMCRIHAETGSSVNGVSLEPVFDKIRKQIAKQLTRPAVPPPMVESDGDS